MREFEASLHAIYKQARVVAVSDVQSPQRRQQQRERVAVAMLGVVLKHREDFRVAFLKAMCGYEPKETNEWTVHLEVGGCGDLAVSSKHFVAVFEFKIDAPLGSHQSPDAKNGYRQKVEEVFAHIPKRRYVVVQKELPSTASASLGPFKTWHDVRDAGQAAPSPLVDDLFESLADLDIPAFSYGKTARMKLAKSAQTAAQVFKLLENVAEGSFGFKKTGWDVSDEDDGYIGKTVAPTKNLVDAKALLKTVRGDLAWYGYEGSRLSVWFYAGPEGTKPVQKILKRLWPGLVVMDKTNVGVRIAPEKVNFDQKFFEDVLGTVFPKKGR